MTGTVLLLHFGANGIRGSEVCLIQTAKAFAERNYQTVVCRNHPAMDLSLNQIYPKPVLINMEFPEIMVAGRQETSLPIFSYMRSAERLNKFVCWYKPALIWCNSGLPCQLAVPIGRLHRVPVLCHFHHPAIKRAYYFWLVVFANKVIFPSQFTRTHSESKANVSGDVIHTGIDLNRFRSAGTRDFRLRSDLGIAPDAIVIGQVGALVANKRPDFLIRAFSSLLDRCHERIHLCLVGKGPMEAFLRELASALGITDHISITGYVDDVLPYYQHVFDINVLVSKEEGLGISAIEGSACSLPVVITRCTGLNETVMENETGFTFTMNDVDDLCARLRLLISNPALRSAIGAAGRVYARQHFSAEAYKEKIIAVADRVLNPARS